MKGKAKLGLAKQLVFAVAIFMMLPGCTPNPANKNNETAAGGELKISLAQWSLHKAFQAGSLDPAQFAWIAKKDFGINAIEYVNSFYKDKGDDIEFWKQMKARADSAGVRSLLIMVDEEGDLGNPDETERRKAVTNHFKWVDAAAILGCHSIRVNAFGEGAPEEVKSSLVDALKQLCTYASEKNINVIIENHGLYSSDAAWVVDAIKAVAMTNCGTLPDFGNWCTTAKWGSTEDNKCPGAYDRYKGTAEFLPYARGLSAKSYQFNKEGEETTIDYKKMLELMKQANFSGYVGIEYEGNSLTEPEGIRATQALLLKSWKALSVENL